MRIAAIAAVAVLLALPVHAQPASPPAEVTQVLTSLAACHAVNAHALGLANLSTALTGSPVAATQARRIAALNDLYGRTVQRGIEAGAARGLAPDALLSGVREVYRQTLGGLITAFGTTMITTPGGLLEHVRTVSEQQRTCEGILLEATGG